MKFSIVAMLAVCGGIAQAQGAPSAQSLTLTAAISLAESRGLAAQSASRGLDASRWRARAFNSRLLPQVGLSAGVPFYRRAISQITQPDGSISLLRTSNMQSELDLTLAQQLPWTGGSFTVASNLSRLDNSGDFTSRLYQSSPIRVGLTQDIFRPNDLKWNRREQSLQSDVAERQYIEAREDIALSTVNAFFDVFSARKTLENATTNVAVNDTLYTLNKGRYEVGKIGENDLLQSELALLRVRNSADEARLNHERALASLRLTLGLVTEAPLEIVAPVIVPTFDADTARAVAEALKNRKQMKDIELASVQARRRVNEARLNTGVGASVSAQVGLDQSGLAFNDAYHAPFSSQQFSVTVNMPFLQWGAHTADVQAARASQDQIASNARLATLQLTQNAHFAALQLSLARRQLEIAAKADTVAQKRFDVAKNRYVIGKIDINFLYTAQNEKDAAVLAYVGALRGYWVAYYQLRRTTLYDFEKNAPIQ